MFRLLKAPSVFLNSPTYPIPITFRNLTTSLLDKLGGYRGLDATARRELRRVTGAEEGRLGALLELWDGAGHLVNLPGALHEAFGAPLIPDAEEVRQDNDAAAPGDDEHFQKKAEPIVDQRTREEKELEAWATGGGLDKAPDTLKELLFEALADSIDWDDLGLERSTFCGKTDARPFRQRSITFTRQGTKSMNSLVILEIPGATATPEEFDKVVIALAGLLRTKREGHWNFPGGSNALALYLRCLTAWRVQVVQSMESSRLTSTW